VGEAVDATLFLVGALLCATATISSAGRRLVIQTAAIGGTVLTALAAGLSAAQTIFSAVMLAIVAAAAMGYATDLRKSTEVERRERQAAERRLELLQVVRTLPELDLPAAARATTRALRSLGSDGAGVSLVRADRLVPLDLDGIPPVGRLTTIRQGLAGQAVTEGRTVRVGDYQQAAGRLPDRDDVGAVICVPIRVDGEPVGVTMALRRSPGEPSDADVEIVEVLAAHLGAVMATHQQLANQRMLLRRMDRLDAMRTAFAQEVSDELRDPLTLIRGAGHTVRAHGEGLAAEDRQRLLDRMCVKADELRLVIDALLDFSRFQSSRREPELRPITLGELFAPLASRIRFEGDLEASQRVEVDVSLVRHAMQLLLGEQRGWVAARSDDHAVTLTFHLEQEAGHALLRSLVAQLAVESGAGVRFDERPELTLPRLDRPVENEA